MKRFVAMLLVTVTLMMVALVPVCNASAEETGWEASDDDSWIVALIKWNARGCEHVAEGVAWFGEKVADGAVWTAEKVADGAVWTAEKVADGAVWTAEKVADGACYVAEKVADGAKAVGGAVASGAKKVWNWITTW